VNDEATINIDPAFRDAVLARSLCTMRQYRRRRRYAIVATLLLAYGAGMGSLVMLQAAKHSRPELPLAQSPPAAAPAQAPRPDPRALLNRVADVPRPEQVRLLTEAGNIYLDDRGDIERALNCYRQVLEILPEDQSMNISPGDTWLFTALKQARMKENHHAQTNL